MRALPGMGSLRRYVPGVAALIAVAFVGTGCAQDSPPRTLPPVAAATSSPTASPSFDKSVAGLEAFVRAYYADVNAAISSGEVDAIRRATLTTCPCRQLDAFIAHGAVMGRFVGFQYSIERIYDTAVSGNNGSALLIYDVPAAKLINARGQVLQSAPAVRHATAAISAIWSSQGWRIANIVKAPS